MTAISERELLACPFCNGTAEHICGGPGNWYVRCTACKSSTDDSMRDTSADAWNTRASADAPVAWQPIETAPKRDEQGRVVEIIIGGGTWRDSNSDWPDWLPLDGWSLASWDGREWCGEQLEQYGEFRFYRPTHWMSRDVIPPLPRPDRASESSAPGEAS